MVDILVAEHLRGWLHSDVNVNRSNRLVNPSVKFCLRKHGDDCFIYIEYRHRNVLSGIDWNIFLPCSIAIIRRYLGQKISKEICFWTKIYALNTIPVVIWENKNRNNNSSPQKKSDRGNIVTYKIIWKI